MNLSNIDPDKCMARKNKKTGLMKQCQYLKKDSDYCLKHNSSDNVLRIDKPLPDKYIKILMEMYTKKIDKPEKKKKNIIDLMDSDDLCKVRFFNNELILTSSKNDDKYIYSYELTFKTLYKKKYADKSYDEIQKILSGDIYKNPLSSQNDIDPISQEEIWFIDNGEKKISDEINKEFLFSYKDKKGFIRGFNILSLKDYLKRGLIKNPITGENIPKIDIERAKMKIHFLEDNKKINVERIDSEVTEKTIKQYTFEVFHKFGKFNIYPKDNWFLDLSFDECSKMYYETRDFFFKNITSINDRKKLIPPDGIAFELNTDNLKKINNKIYLQYYLLMNIDKIISNCRNESLQTLGAYIALGGLCTVCNEAREVYPHIAFSFM